jgi:hypothetical protein
MKELASSKTESFFKFFSRIFYLFQNGTLQIFIKKVKFLIDEKSVEENLFKQNHENYDKLKNLLLKWSLEITSIYLYLIQSGMKRINDILQTKKLFYFF